MTTDQATTISLHHVGKRFRRGAEAITAVADVSLVLAPGTLTVVSGPSGSGKTTLLNLALGWDTPDTGEVSGLPARPDWSQVAVVPQRLGLLDHLTVAENVALPAHRRLDATSLDTTLRAVAIEHVAARFPIETSLGEQQRTAVARALVLRPAVLIADEPSSHQDELRTRLITDELLAAARNGSAVLVATHDTRIAERADRRFEMRDGVLRPAA